MTGTTSRVRRLRRSSERISPYEDPSPPTPSEPVPLPSWLGEPPTRQAPRASTSKLAPLRPRPYQLEILRDGEVIGRRVFHDNAVRIGRSPTCGLCLEDSTVSRVHAAIERSPGGWYVVRDLASTNGVKVNGRAVTTWTLNEGDELTLGAFVLRFSFEAAAAGEPPARPAPAPIPPTADPSDVSLIFAPPPAPAPAPPAPPPPVSVPEGPFGRTIVLPPVRFDAETRERSLNHRAYLTCLEGAHKAGIKVCQLVIERDVFLIGGGEDADLRIPSCLVPRITTVIVRGHGGWSVVQVAPWPWIAKVNDQPIDDREWIEEGDQLLLPGGLLLAFHHGIPR